MSSARPQPWVRQWQLLVPTRIEQVFAFFTDAGNLQRITPPWLDFRIVSSEPIDMRQGAVIDYRLKVHGLPMKWRSLIREWNPPHRFVDEQVRGPYKMWIHEHSFEPKDEATLCRDRVTYDVPGGPLRGLINRVVVARDIERIFQYRTVELRRIFDGEASAGAGPT